MSSVGRQSLLSWEDIPQGVLELVFLKLELDGGLPSLLPIRTVSRAWKLAMDNYPAAVAIVHPREDLASVCRLLPSMASLQVWKASKWEEVDLYPLRSLTPGQLTSVSLNNKQQLPAIVDLRWIPASVRELNMKGFTVRPNHPRALEGLRLHSLDCRNGEMPPTETWRLLQCLPGLKALRVGGWSQYDPSFESAFVSAIGRLSELTSLELFRGKLVSSMDPRHCPGELRELHLNGNLLTAAWLESFLASTPKLTALNFEHCCCVPGEKLTLEWAPKLRALVLRSGSPPLLTLPSNGLECLSWTQHYQDSRIEAEEVLKIASLSALTRLELHKWKKWQDLSALRVLPLVELVLVGCEGMEGDLFAPGALQSLQRLHIENGFWRWSLADRGDGGEKYEREMRELGEVVLAIPPLREVSGDCGLFFLGMVEQLQSWQMRKSEVSVGHWLWTWVKA